MNSYKKLLAKINFLYYCYLHITITVVIGSNINEAVPKDKI